MFSSVARWSGQITWHASNPGSILNRVAFFFFDCCCLFVLFAFFYPLICSPFIPLLALYLSFTSGFVIHVVSY